MKMRRALIQTTLVVLASAILGNPLSGMGAVANVTVNNSNLGFVPATANINTGDKVIWTWPVGSFDHNVYSSSSPQAWTWPGGRNNLVSGPFTFTNTFTAAGSFPYSCTLHGFTGTINVQAAANVPPTVSISSPAADAVFAAPANVTVQASASDSDGSVANVQFLDGSTIFSTVNAAPFSATANNLAAGNHTLSAIVSDNLGAKATNSVTIHVINPSPVTVTAPAVLSAGHFQFSYSADIGLTYVIQVSTNLSSGWTAIATNTATSNPVIFSDANAGSAAFYRVGLLPNP